MAIILSNLNQFTKYFVKFFNFFCKSIFQSIETFLGKFAVNCLLKIQTIHAYVATLSCENNNVRK